MSLTRILQLTEGGEAVTRLTDASVAEALVEFLLIY